MKIQDNLPWEVQEKFIYTEDLEVIPKHKMLTRSDNGELLNICKDSYTVLTNSFFMNTVEKMASIVNMDLAGYSEMDSGKKIVSYLEAGNKNIAGHDYDNYMVLGNSHDYSTGFFMASSSVMLRCKNEFSKLYKGRKFSFQHTASIEYRVDDLLRKYESWMNEQQRLEEKLNKWSRISIDKEITQALIRRLVDIELDKEESISTRKKNKINDISLSIERETGDLGDNLLGLFQGITYYTTHVYKQKENVYGNLFGSASKINNDAFSFAESVESGDIVLESPFEFQN